MTDTQTTLAEFVAANDIEMTCVRTDRNPNMDPTGDSPMDHWKCTLMARQSKMTGKKQMTVVFSKGIGHKGAEPTVDEVLDCLASDAASVAGADGFEDWAANLGFDPDSRKAEKSYNQCLAQSEKLRDFLGGEPDYDRLLYRVERL